MIDMRYIAIIIIFLASIFGAIITILLSKNNNIYKPYFAIKLFSGGVIASLALVHIIPDVITSTNYISEFPIGGITILFGLFFLIIIENLSHSLYTNNENEEWTIMIKTKLLINEIETIIIPYNHVCITNLNIHSIISLKSNINTGALPKYQIKNIIILYIFEFACIFHSFIIGLSLGFITDQYLVKKLMIALLFHQFLEGLSLGSIISMAYVSKIKITLMILSYAITTPIGIIIGILIIHSQDVSKSDTWIIIQGCLLGISAGMLIYISMIQITDEFNKKELYISNGLKKKLYMYLSLLSGAGLMCILAIWV